MPIPDSLLVSALAGVVAWYATDRAKPDALWDRERGAWRSVAHSARGIGATTAAVTWWWAQQQNGTATSGSFSAITLGDIGGSADFETEGLFRAGVMSLDDLM